MTSISSSSSVSVSSSASPSDWDAVLSSLAPILALTGSRGGARTASSSERR
eukprot:CAMPEP_0115314906 /NCGR_PEP_ID=MMETSP0270-20121206/77294_1 /TAXON_ID=71861 /ORGANISM="Scrippsiella trochoidea, Strain CCMP3099" /LENGTH=50 /DNA_ID=CAMNT_0002734187 /DNA_START=267 /DNA_END=419 /DNA_ORIENTATION=+